MTSLARIVDHNSSVSRNTQTPEESTFKNTFKECTTRLDIEFSGTLSKMAGNFVIQRITPAAANAIFNDKNYRSNTQDGNDLPHEKDLKKAIIKCIRVGQTQSSFPYSLSFDASKSGIPSNCNLVDGSACLFIIRPNENSPRGIFSEVYIASFSTDDGFMRRYAHLSPEKIAQGLIKMNDSIAVPLDHEIANILKIKENQERRKYNFSDWLIHDGCVMVPKIHCETAYEELKNTVLKCFNYQDLTKFAIEMRRTDGRNFEDVTGTRYEGLSSETDKFYATNQFCSASFMLEIKWAYPCREKDGNASSPSAHQSPTVSPAASKFPVRH